MSSESLEKLKPSPHNPRKISDEKLKMLRSALREYGDLSGIVFNRRTKRLVGGHQRVKVFDEGEIRLDESLETPSKTGTVARGFIHCGDEHYTYREVDWDEDRETAANIAANQHGGDWEMKLLSEQLIHLDTGDFDMNNLGFSQEELADILAPTWGAEDSEKDDVVPEPLKDAITKPGDLWLLGAYLECDKCGEHVDYEKTKIDKECPKCSA